MPIDTKRMNKRREDVKKASGKTGGDLYTFEPGETKVYLHPQSYPEDDHELTRGYNFIEIVQHYGVGGKKGGVVCLDPETNPIINHPLVRKFLAARKNPVKLPKDCTCPVCTAGQNGELTEEEQARQRAQPKWLFGLTPMAYRKSKDDEWARQKFEPRVHIAGVTIFNGLTGEMIDAAPDDITDPKNATLVVVIRTGKEFGSTEYDVKSDRETARKPMSLDKGQRRVIAEAVKPEGPCDLFKVVANLIKSPAEVKAQMVGVKVAEDEPEGDDEDRKSCFGLDFEEGDDECSGCPEVKECRAACEGGSSDDGEPEGDDAGGDDEPEADGDEEPEATDPEGDGDDEPEGDGEEGNIAPPKCYGTWEDCSDCKSCGYEEQCSSETAGGAGANGDDDGEPEENPSEPPPGDDEPEADGNAGADQNDEDLAAIQKEADQLAAQSRRNRAAKGKGKGKGGRGKR